MSHTILLVQPAGHNSRTFDFYPSLSVAVDNIIKRFEDSLRSSRPHQRQITYDVKDLFSWLDGMTDISALVLDTKVNKYDPHPRQWLKERVFDRLKEQAKR